MLDWFSFRSSVDVNWIQSRILHWLNLLGRYKRNNNVLLKCKYFAKIYIKTFSYVLKRVLSRSEKIRCISSIFFVSIFRWMYLITLYFLCLLLPSVFIKCVRCKTNYVILKVNRKFSFQQLLIIVTNVSKIIYCNFKDMFIKFDLCSREYLK